AGALGLWTGLAPLFFIWAVASVLAGLHAALWLALRRWPVAPRLFRALSSPRIARDGDGERNTATPARKARHVPLAAYLAMATLIWIAGGRGSAPALAAPLY
ncbi:MAG TPA: peptidase A24, partial [Comamonadaceae bacterium]|nr:peptidase A24 [Comamonadaceae bacterium]